MDAFTPGDEPETPSLVRRRVKKARIPTQGSGNGAPVGKLDDQRILGDIYRRGLERGGIKDQSSHASIPKVVIGAAQVNGKAC